jgi:hypothetical protein
VAYPDEPPVFRFVTVPFHINVSDEGRPCMNTLSTHYQSTASVFDLLGHVRGLLLMPNYEDPIDAAKQRLRHHENPAEFSRRVTASVANGKATWEEFTTGVPVSDEAPADFVMPEVAVVPEQFNSPVTGQLIPPEERVVASSGIIYGRAELLAILRSSPTPRCIVTGRLLTDDPSLLE